MNDQEKIDKKRASNKIYMKRWREKNLELAREKGRTQYNNLTPEQKERARTCISLL